MGKGRLEAFSDGVLAIIITIMVLEIKVPHGDTLETLKPLLPVFLSYMLSFIYIGIYWNNHHHMLHLAQHINGQTLWANTHLLFWLSLVPFGSEWMNESGFATWPVALYGFLLLMAGAAYYILEQVLVKLQGSNSPLANALGADAKGVISIITYVAGIASAFFYPAISLTLYAAVAAMWFIPDKRIEKVVSGSKKDDLKNAY